MTAAKDIRKNLSLFVDGRGYAGQISDFTAPKLAEITEDYRAGGMNAAVAVKTGMEKLEAGFNLFQYSADIIAMWGLRKDNAVQCAAREALESADGTVTAVEHTMRGRISEFDPGTSKPGELQPIQLKLSLKYYKLEHGGRVLQEIDVENMIHIVNGVDQLAALRAALAI